MSSGGYPSSSERKQYTEEEQKVLTWIRQCRSQPITYDQSPTNPINTREIILNAPSEIIHIPPEYQRFQSVLDLPHAAAAVIRNSSSTSRTLVQPVPGHYVIELNAPNSSNETGNRQDTSVPDSTSTWSV